MNSPTCCSTIFFVISTASLVSQSVHFQSHAFSLLEDGRVATKVNVCMSTCMCICTMLYLIVFHLSKVFTYPNKMFVAFDQWGSDN